MLANKQEIGRWGEEEAVRYYQRRSYVVIARNFRCQYGEIDIICRKKNVLYFIEVKTRTSTIFGLPEEAVTLNKRETMMSCAREFLSTYTERNMRFFVFQICAVSVLDSRVFISIYTDN